VKRFVIEVSLRRRHLNDFQRAEPGAAPPRGRELARERMLRGDPRQKFAKSEALEFLLGRWTPTLRP
jgi:hypothetical protein